MAVVKLNSAAMAEMLRGPEGPVARYVIVKSTEVQDLARVQVGKRTLRLMQSIVKRFVRIGGEFAVMVGSTLSYALLHHEGTRPHVIVPTKARVLRFATAGGVRFATIVHHPGTRPNRYLADPLRVVFSRS